MATIQGVVTDLRKDLLDTDSGNYIWTDDQLYRYIDHALIEVSQVSPQQTTASYVYPASPTRELNLDLMPGISNYISIEAVEYPKGKYPRQFVRFSQWASKLYLELKKSPLEGDEIRVWFGKKHDFKDTDDYTAWLPDTPYTSGTIRRPTTKNGYTYKVTVPGTSGASEPTWPKTYDATVTDGEVTWKCRSGDLTLPDHLHELVKIGAAAYAAIAWGVRATNLVTVGGASVDRDYASWGMERLRFYRDELERLGKQAVGKQRKLYE